MQKHTLTISKREVSGKKVKQLRKEGILPANIYGKGIEPISVQVPLADFLATYKQTGASGLVEVSLGSEKRPVLIHEVQLDYLTQQPVHADFYQVNLAEKVKTMIPVVLTGEPAAVADKQGMLLQILKEIEVEALPGDLPENFEVDVTHLATVDDQVTVAELKKPTAVDILTSGEELVAKIAPLVSEEAAKQAAEEVAASEEASAEAEEQAPAAESEAKSEETPKQEGK